MIGKNPLSISSLSVHEILVSLKEKEVPFFQSFFQEVLILDYDGKTAEQSSAIEKKLRKKGQLINSMDILIAGTCLRYGYGLITCDRDFEKVQGLRSKIF